MSELRNFPFKNQLNSPTFDGRPDENRNLNCVQTCIAAGLQYFTGKEFEPDELKDAIWGEGYTGGTAAVGDIAYCAKQGVKLYAISSNDPNYLVQQAHAHLAMGHPVLCTFPSNGLPPVDRWNPGNSHVVVFYKDSPGVLIAMNPWNAWAQANSDAWWANRFCYGQIWIMERGNMSGVPQGWKDSGGVLVAPNGKAVVQGFRDWVLAHDWRSDDAPLDNAFGTGPQATRQDFVYEYLTWDAKAGVQVHQYGQEYLQAVSDIQALQAQVTALQAKLDQAPPPNAEVKASLTSIDQAVQALIQKVG